MYSYFNRGAQVGNNHWAVMSFRIEPTISGKVLTLSKNNPPEKLRHN